MLYCNKLYLQRCLALLRRVHGPVVNAPSVTKVMKITVIYHSFFTSQIIILSSDFHFHPFTCCQAPGQNFSSKESLNSVLTYDSIKPIGIELY